MASNAATAGLARPAHTSRRSVRRTPRAGAPQSSPGLLAAATPREPLHHPRGGGRLWALGRSPPLWAGRGRLASQLCLCFLRAAHPRAAGGRSEETCANLPRVKPARQSLGPRNQETGEGMYQHTVDFIVVGAGSAGAAL